MVETSESAGALSPWWRQVAILVMIAGFAVLSFLTVLTYKNAPPVPQKVVDSSGAVILTGAEIEKGQEVFFKYGLMEHGTLWGHGAYLGPDYSAEYLHRLAEITRDTLSAQAYGKPYSALSQDEQSVVSVQTRKTLKQNRYDAASATLVFTPGEVQAYRTQSAEWSDFFTKKDAAPGLPSGYIKNPEELRALNAYFAWATWATVANRPGKNYTYTNNWPYDPEAGNQAVHRRPMSGAPLSVVAAARRPGSWSFSSSGSSTSWAGRAKAPPPTPRSISTASLPLTPSQRATGKYFAVVALLFLLQSLVGGALAHYRVEPFSFYGLGAILRLARTTSLRTYHLQLAIFWIATAWVAGGLFLAPLVGGGEPTGQKRLVDVLFWALVLVVGGSLLGEYLGSHRTPGPALVLARATRVPSTWTSVASGSCSWPPASCSGSS